ncbi:lactonase family protein [Acidicapsa ligni]|uniref:lactonase family protein n=1 Tax=Acidicapsa ligni TaxID=542300 RepID=UPI0021DF91F8|nr:lactonase family protein [Acidicapsa ligni]
MKFNKVGQVALVSATALILASAFTACNPVTIDFLFVAGDNNSTVKTPVDGQIQTFEIDRVSGALNIVNSTVSSGGITPVSEAVSTDFKNFYVANQGDSTLVQFGIGGSGQLTSVKTTTMSAEGNTPVAITMNAAGTLLFVANRYQPGCNVATDGAETCNGGALAVFPVGSDGTLGASVSNGSLNYWPVGINPTSVNSLANGTAAYVSTYNPTSGIGFMYGFSSSAAGALTSIAGTSNISGKPFPSGVKPVAIASDPTSRFVYVTDFAQNELIAFSVLDGGVLNPLINGPFKTGNQPSAITVDPRGKFIYIANELDNTVSAYNIDLSTGTPSAAVNTTGSTTNTTGTQPVAILVDNAYGRYVYTANFLDNSLTGFLLNSSTGTITTTQSGPYPSVNQPVAVVSVPRGNHSIQVVQP